MLFRQNSEGGKGRPLNNAASWVIWVGLLSPDYVSCSGMSCYAPSFPRQPYETTTGTAQRYRLLALLMPRKRKGVKSRIEKR